MKELRDKIDTNDLEHIYRLFKRMPIAAEPCPIKQGRIHPTTTRFYWKDGQATDVIHIKPIYYQTLVGTWRPMSEVAAGFGNRWINFKENWADLMHPRYYLWLQKRMELIKGSIGLPFPIQKSLLYATVTTVYPDPSPETTSVDGSVQETTPNNDTWANKVNGTGDGATDSNAVIRTIQFTGGTNTDTWLELYRGVYLFDTSSIPDTDTIDAATFSLNGDSVNTKADPQSNTPNINVYSSAPASNTALVAGDFDSLGAVEFSTSITFAGWTNTDYNDFVLNATGRADISKTGVSKFGTRNANYDVANSAPTWGSGNAETMIFCDGAEIADTTSDPKLAVTHTAVASGPANVKTWQNLAKASVKTVNSLAMASIKTRSGLA